MNSWIQNEKVKNNERNSEMNTSKLKLYQFVKYTTTKNSYHIFVILTIEFRILDVDNMLIFCFEI